MKKLSKSKENYMWMQQIRDLERLWNMKVNVILIVVQALETVPKNLEKRLNQMEMI